MHPSIKITLVACSFAILGAGCPLKPAPVAELPTEPPVVEPQCSDANPCFGDFFCKDGRCVSAIECLQDEDCGPDHRCERQMCVPKVPGTEAVPGTSPVAPPAPKPVSLEPYYVAYTADGASKALAQGRATVLYFWAAWCPICRADEPKIKERIEGSDLPVAGFRVNYDVESDLKAKYKIPYQHTTVFLDKTGVEVDRLSGPVDDATFMAALKKATE